MISSEILNNYAFTEKEYLKGQQIFEEGNSANFYYQVKKGEVKIYNLTFEGKEFVQGYFKDGQSFGEPPLLGSFRYPANAITIKKTVLQIISKETYLTLLKENPEVHLELTTLLSNRMHYKATIAKEVSIYPPEHRILTLLNFIKSNAKATTPFEIELTRLQISELTGLRVETVIRTIKKLAQQKKLSIINRKVYI